MSRSLFGICTVFQQIRLAPTATKKQACNASHEQRRAHERQHRVNRFGQCLDAKTHQQSYDKNLHTPRYHWRCDKPSAVRLWSVSCARHEICTIAEQAFLAC